MAESSKDTDQSMEDILQSIKRIIADEGDPAAVVPGSDVLELTDLLAEDAAAPAATMASAAMVEPEPEMTSQGSQEALDALFSDEPAPMAAAPMAPAAAAPMPEPEPVVAAPASASPPPAPEPVATPMAAAEPEAPAEERLISDEALAASVAALHALPTSLHAPVTHRSEVFRSGTTVEDLVIESLKPMLKEWLDTNLPALVRSLVEREIRRLSL